MTNKKVRVVTLFCSTCERYFSVTKGHEFRDLNFKALMEKVEQLRKAGIYVQNMDHTHLTRCSHCRARQVEASQQPTAAFRSVAGKRARDDAVGDYEEN